MAKKLQKSKIPHLRFNPKRVTIPFLRWRQYTEKSSFGLLLVTGWEYNQSFRATLSGWDDPGPKISTVTANERTVPKWIERVLEVFAPNRHRAWSERRPRLLKHSIFQTEYMRTIQRTVADQPQSLIGNYLELSSVR